MKIFIKARKFISVITALCLLISFVIGPTAVNAMTNEEATAKYKQIFKDFMLPYNYGQITSAHYAGTDRVIINIQDLHCHPKVQKNISNIIEIFDKSFGVKNVYLEGVYGRLSTKWITDRIENIKKGEILDKMLETGRLTGAEYYSATSGKTEIIRGLEEKEPYLDNLKRFGEIVENQERINLILTAMDESLSKIKQQYYTKRQYKLEELSKNYRDGTITPQKYYALLSKHIEKLGIDLNKYENTFTYITLLEMQKTLDYSKITNELQNLILLLRENLANSAYQMLVDNTENFSKIDKLYGYIVRISRELGLDLTVNFPNLDNYFGYIEFSQKINPLELIVEEKKLTEEINTRFSETKAQREVVFLTNFEKYLKDYVSSKITSDDYEYYKENIDTFRQLWNKYVDNRVLSLLDEYLAEADKFYKINTDRNIYFTNNMFTERDVLGKLETEVEAKGDVNKIIDNMKGVKEVDVVITGGFHSQTVTEILKNHGVSYIVITPNVTDGVKLAEETYYEIAKEQSKISFQTLATLPFSAYPENLRVRAAVMAFGKDIAKEIFPNKVAEIDSMDMRKFTDEEKAIARQMKKLRKSIEESKFLESDDQSLEDFLEKISGETVDKALLEYVNLEDLKRILTGEEAGSIKRILEEAAKRRDLSENGTTMQQAIESFKDIFRNIEDRFTSQEEYSERQKLINLIRALPKLSNPHKKLLMSRDGKHKRILEELSKYDYDRLEKYGQEDLQHYLKLTKQLWNIKEIISPDQVRREIEESFAKVEMFFTLIGYSAPQGNYEEITMSVLAPLMEKISKELGKERFGILSSPTASQGSIDAASTVLSQMYDALMVYITAKSYLGYVEPEKFPGAENFKKIEDFLVNMDKADLMKNGTNLREFLNAFKFVAENGDVYSKAVAQTKNVPNFAIIIGGRAVSIENDLINAYEEGNDIFLINSRLLAAQSPAITEKRAINNSVEYFLFLVDLIDKGVIRVVKRNNKGEIEDEDKALMAKGIIEFITDDIVFDSDKVTGLSPEEQELYKLLRSNELSPKIKKLIGILFEKGVKNRDDLGKLKIHVMDLDDADIDTTAGEKKVKEQLKEKGKTLAEKIFEIIKNFIKPALTADDLEWAGSVKSAEVEVQAFDLEYAKSHGYLEGVEEAEAKYDEDGYRYYVLKSEYDKGRHVTARIYDADPDNSTLSAKTNASVNPMFVVSEKGSVSFMGREKFERIYRSHVSKDKTVGQIFNATKREVEVEVSFAEPMSIIETDEGRDTVLPYYIVVKGIGKPYAMSIQEFMRIYPQGKNPEFYKQHKEQIDKLLSEYSNFEGQTEQKESIEQQEEQTQQQVSKQQTQKKKKVNIKNIIVSLLLSAVLAFSALNIGSSLAERTDVATAPSGIEMTLETGVDATQETQEFQEAQEIVAPEISQKYIDDTWHYFDNNDIGYRSSSRKDFRDSIIFSNQPNVLRLVQELKNLLRERLDFPIDDDTKIIFMKGTGKNNAACACFEINTIVICVDNLSTDSMDSLISLLSGNIPEEFYSRKYDENEISPMDQALSLLQQFVHEGTHLDNFKNKNLSPLEDEMTAIYAEITVVHKLMDEEMLDMDLLEKCSVRISKPDMRLDTGERVNHVAAMKYLAFENAVTKGESQILRDFRKIGDTNVSFYNVHYADNGIIYPKNNLKDVGPIEEGLVSTGMILILVDNETGASISYVTDVGINVDFKPTKEQLDDLRINHQQQKTEEQGETTKDGTRSRVKTVESSVGKGKQAKQSTGQMTREEIRGILERTPLNGNRVKKAKIINSFVYIAYNLNVSKEVLNKFLLPLARELSERRIDDISTEANYLTFKILLNKYFQENKQTKTRMTDYEDAMKMGRLLYYTIGDKAADLTEQQIDQILPLLMDIYYKGVEQLQSRNTVTDKTGFYCLLGMEEECTNEGWESIFNLLGINPTREYFKCTGKSWKDRDIAGAWLDAIRNYPKNKAEHGLENIYVIYSGHGQPTHLSTGDYSVKVEDIVEALLDAEKNGANLNEITIDLATCWSYFSSINIIELLKERGAKTFPNIVTDAGYESLKGKFIDMKSSPVSISSTDLVSGSSNVTLSNKEVSLIEYILAHKTELAEREEKGLSLADFHNAERASANYTVFAVTNEEMENLFDNLRQNVFEILGLSSDEITYGTKEMEITEYLDRYEEHERTVLVQRWLAKKGNMIYMELLLAKTKAILDWIGNTKIIRALYKDNAGENFKNTRLGKAIGVNLETFAFWMPKFVAAHNFRYASQDSGARAVVWRIRSLSIGIGMGFGVLSAIINLINPITATIAIPAIITTLVAILITANTFHYFYDIGVYNGIDPSELENMVNDIDREQAIRNAKLEEIQPGFGQLIEQKSRIMTISEFFKEKGFVGSAKELGDSDGIALGLLSHELLKNENNEGIFVKLISAICRTTNIADWQIALRYFADRKPEWGLVGVTSDKYMPELVEYCKRTNKKIYFFLPNETKEYSRTRGQAKVDPRIANNESSRTRNELKWLKDHPEALPYVEFVVGAYDFLDVESVEEYNKYFSDDKKTTDTVSAMLRTPELFGEQTQSRAETQGIELLSQPKSQEKRAKTSPTTKQRDLIQQYFSMNQDLVTQQQVLDKIFDLMKNLSEGQKQELYGTYIGYLKNYLKVITELSKYGKDLNLSDIHDDLYYLIKEGMIPDIAISIFAPYYKKEITYEQFKTKVDKAKIVMKYFRTNGSEKYAFVGLLWFADLGSYFLEQNKALVDRIYRIGIALDKFIEKQNIIIGMSDDFGRKMGEILQTGFEAGKSNRYIIRNIESYLKGEITRSELMDKLKNGKENIETDYPVEKQQILNQIFNLMKNLSEENRQQLSELNIDSLDNFLEIITELTKYGKDININDIHNDLYYFIKEEMLPSIIISIFEPYYRGKITYNNLKTNIDKAKILMKYFRTNASEKLNSRNMWFYDSTFNLLEKNKRLVNRIYKIGKALDEFIEKENIDTEIDDMKGRDIGHLLQNAFEAGRSNQYIIKIIEEFLSGKITYYEAYERMERLKITKKIEGLRGKLKKQYIKLRLSGYKYRDVFLDEISDMESFDWQNRKKLLKKLLSSTRDLSEEEVRYLAQNTSVLLSASDYYNTELSSTVRSIGKINGNILKLLKEKNFEAEGPASAMLLLELLSTNLEVNESNYEQLEDLMIDLSNNAIYHFALESDALPLKVFFSSAFQNQYKDLPVLIQYRSAIKISRFMEVTETASIFTRQNLEGQDKIIKEAIYTLSEILKKAGEKTFLDENTKVLMVNHNERNEDGSYRFTSQAFRNIMENLFMPNPENLSEEEIDKILKKIDGMMNVYGESDKEGFSTSRNRIFNFFERINKFGIPISITAPILVVLSNTVPVLGFLLSPALVILFVVLFQIVVTLIDKGELVEAQKMFANISIKNGFNQRKQVGRFFKAISDFRYKEGKTENLLAILNGHGSAGLWFYSDMGFVRVAPRFARSIEKLIKDMEQEKWTEKDIEETVDRMKQENKTEKEIEEEVNNIRKKINDGSRRWTDEDIKNTVEHITIDLSCCYSYRTAEIVKKEFAKRKIKYCPQIVSEAGKEMVFGYGGSEGGNLERAIYSYIKEDHPEVREHRRISLKDIFYSEIINSNHTIFMMDDSVKGLFDDFIGKVKKIESSSEQSQQDVQEVSQERKRSLSSATIIPSNLAEKFAKILENRRLGGESRESYYAELQSEPTKKRLEEYAERQKAKGKKDKAYENPEKFRFTAKGKLLGVWYEMLDLWKIFSIHTAIFGKEINVNSFIEEHENPTMAQIIAVWVIRALSIGLGVGTGAILAASFTPFAGIFGIPALLATEFITHLMWNLRKPQATVLFNKESSQISFLINKEGNKYSLIFNPRTGGIYLSSNNEDAFSDASQAITKSEYATPESIEQLLDLKINISGHSITVKSNDTGATVNAIKHSNIPKIISSLSSGELITSEEDEKALELLKEHLHIEGDVETVYLDRADGENRPQAKRALEGNKLLVVYPFSNSYDINSLTDEQLFSLYLQLNNNLLDALKTWLPALSDDKLYFVGVTILNEFVKNAIVHGNLADLSKPLYIKYDENGFTVYNAYNGKTNKRRLSVSAAAGLSGAHVGLSLVQKNVDDGVVSVTPEQERIVEIGDRTFYAIGAFQSNKIQKISEGYPERAEAPYYHHGTSLQSALQILADGKLRTDVPMANGYHPAEIYMVEASYVPLMEAKYSINSGYDFARGYATNDQGIVDGVVLGFAGKTRHYKPIPKTLGFDMKELSLSGDEEGNVRLSEISFSSDEYLENFIKEMLSKNIKLPKNVAFRVKNNKVDKYISRNELEKIISDLESQQTAPQVETKPQVQQQQTVPQVETEPQTQQQQTASQVEQTTQENEVSVSDKIKRMLERVNVSLSNADIEIISAKISKKTNKHFSVTDSNQSNVLEELFNGTKDLPEDVLASLTKLFKLDGSFTAEDSRVIHDYVFADVSDEDKQRERENQMKMYAVIYAYMSWKKKFGDDFTTDKTIRITKNNESDQNFPTGIKFSFDDWLHICDGHSILMNGNEEYIDRYEDANVAFNSAITLDFLMDSSSENLIGTIINDWDLCSERESNTLYIKNINNKIYVVVINMNEKRIETFFVIDSKKYEDNYTAEIKYATTVKRVQFSELDSKIKEGELFFKVRVDEHNNILGTKDAGTNSVGIKYCIGFENNRFIFYNDMFYDELYKFDVVTRQKIMEIKKDSGLDAKFLIGSRGTEKTIVMIGIVDGRLRIIRIEKNRLNKKPYVYSANDIPIGEGLIISNIKKLSDKEIEINFSNNNAKLVLNIENKEINTNTKEEMIEALIEGNPSLSSDYKDELKKYVHSLFEILKTDSIILPFEKMIINMIDPYDKSNLEFLLNLVKLTDSSASKDIQKEIVGKTHDFISGSELVDIFIEMGIVMPVENSNVSVQQESTTEEMQYQYLIDLVKASVNPIQLIMDTIGEIFDTNKAMDMKGKNIIVDVDVDEALRERAKSAGINIVKLRIITEQEARQRGGLLINEQAKIRMTFDSSANELLVYSKQGIDLSREKIKELIAAAYSEGRKNLEFSNEQVISFAERGDIIPGSDDEKVKQSLANIQDRIANAAINGMQRAEVEVSLDLSGMKKIGRNLASKCNKQFATTIIINAEQLDKYGSEINGLRADGFRFILRGSITEIQDAFENASDKGYLLDGAILDEAERGDLSKLEELAANNTEGILHIETQMYVNMATAKGIDANRIYTDNGIIPIINVDQVAEMTEKYAIGYGDVIKDKSTEEIEAILSNMLSTGNLANILCTDNEGTRLENLRKRLANIFKNMFGTMNELLKPKSPEQRITEETAAVSDYNFGKEFGEEIRKKMGEGETTMREELLNSLKDRKNILRRILTTEITEESKAEELVREFEGSATYKQLPSAIQMRIQTAISKGNYFEAIGTIRGAANQIIDSFVLGQSAFETEDQVELRDKYLKKEYKEYRQYVRIRALQLVMAGENLSSLLESRPDTNQTVEQLFDAIRTELNKDVRKTIIANKTAIKEIKAKDEIENAKTNLMNVNILLDDSLRDKLVVTKQLDISAQTVRSILAAA